MIKRKRWSKRRRRLFELKAKWKREKRYRRYRGADGRFIPNKGAFYAIFQRVYLEPMKDEINRVSGLFGFAKRIENDR
jgi:hypothetical protein